MSLCEVKKVGVTADNREYEFKIIWYSVIIIIPYHLFGLYGFYLNAQRIDSLANNTI